MHFIRWFRSLGSSVLLSLAAFLDLLAQLGDRCTDTFPAFEETTKLERQLLIYPAGERDQRVPSPPSDGAAHVFDLSGEQLERVHIVPKALRPLAFLTNRLLRGGERHDGCTDRAKRCNGEQPGPTHGADHATRGDADRGDAGGKGRQSQPMPCGRLVTLATLSEVRELILKQVIGDEVECSVLSRRVGCRGVGDEAIEILAAQLFCTGSALHPVTR